MNFEMPKPNKKKHTDTQKRAFLFGHPIGYHFDLVQIAIERIKFPSSLLKSSNLEKKKEEKTASHTLHT